MSRTGHYYAIDGRLVMSTALMLRLAAAHGYEVESQSDDGVCTTRLFKDGVLIGTKTVSEAQYFQARGGQPHKDFWRFAREGLLRGFTIGRLLAEYASEVLPKIEQKGVVFGTYMIVHGKVEDRSYISDETS